MLLFLIATVFSFHLYSQYLPDPSCNKPNFTGARSWTYYTRSCSDPITGQSATCVTQVCTNQCSYAHPQCQGWGDYYADACVISVGSGDRCCCFGEFF